MSEEQIQQARREAENSVAAWLLTLEIARAAGDVERVSEAHRELLRRGVEVHYRPSTARRREAASA